jgi:hypothetical protein
MAKSESTRYFNMTDIAKESGINRSEALGICKGLGIAVQRVGNSIVIGESDMKRVLAVVQRSAKQPA